MTQAQHTVIQELRKKGTDCRSLAELGRSAKIILQIVKNIKSLEKKLITASKTAAN